MKFKRIYVEITNVCNLSCSFCSLTRSDKREMTPDEFEIVMRKICDYTDYVYLHVKGEPLTHHYLDDILGICKKYKKRVCITTNGVFIRDKLDVLNKYDNIYQINISLHSENNKSNYIDDIFYSVDRLSCYVSYRFWTLDKSMDTLNNKYLDMIRNKYNVLELYDKMKLEDNVYLSLDSKFDWPSTYNEYYNENGTCLGGKKQIAILASGTVCVCCLDAEGESNLGNIFADDMEDILSSDKYLNTIKGFNSNKVYLDICKHRSYKDRFCK